jgi:hypothetical protein
MKKYLYPLFLATALVAVIAALIYFQKLPSDFWSLSLAEKWLSIKAFFAAPNAGQKAKGMTRADAKAADAKAAETTPPKK